MKKVLSIIAVAGLALVAVIFGCEKEKEVKVELPTLTTLSVSEITTTTAKSGGNITNNGGGEINSRGVVWGTSSNPTLEQHAGVTYEGNGSEPFASTLENLTPGTNYYVRAYATNSAGTAFGNQVEFETQEDVGIPTGQPCPSTPTVNDIDGNVYNTVLIGDQCWMKENLKTTHFSNGDPIEYPGSNISAWQNNTTGAYAWYDNELSWKDSYGALYNWQAVVNDNGLCPEGWHIPSMDEWIQLVEFVVSQGFPNIIGVTNSTGNALKSCRQMNTPVGGDCNTTEHPRWYSDEAHFGFDKFGFSGLPGGDHDIGGGFCNLGSIGFWWSSTEYESVESAWSCYMFNDFGFVAMNSNNKRAGFSARCIRD